MRKRRMKRLTVLAGVCGALAVSAVGAAAQRGTITGRVLDTQSRQPIAGAQVVLVGSAVGMLSNAQGEYRIQNVPAGPVTVRAIMLGYDTQERAVTVPANGTATANFELFISAVALNEVVVTATGEQRKKELANVVSSIQAAKVVEAAPIASVDELLNGRAAGLQVMTSGGTVGTGARIRIRGANSVSLSNEPVIFVDGSRVSSDPQSGNAFVSGQAGSRLNDLNPEDIESIEVVKGPSAAALYGTDAANGVIRITTKHGRAGAPRWSAYVETGVLTDPNTYPLNYRGKQANAATATDCFTYQVSQGTCTQATVLSYQPLSDPIVSPFQNGNTQLMGLSLSGGGDVADYYVSADFLSQRGVLGLTDTTRAWWTSTGQPVYDWMDNPNEYRRINLRGNFGARVGQGLSLRISNGYVTSRLHLPPNDNNALGMVPSGLLGTYSPELGTHGYGYLSPPKVFVQEAMQEIDRYTSSVQANWQPQRLAWLSGRATVGLDLTDRHDSYFSPVGAITEFGAVRTSGLRNSNRSQNHSWTVDGSFTATRELAPWLSSRTTAGAQYYHSLNRLTTARGEGLTPGTKSVGAASTQFAGETTSEVVTLGAYAEEQLGYRDRLFVNVAGRGDDNSAFGTDYGFVLYPKLGGSFVALQDGGSPVLGVLNSLRLRAAWGASGVAPQPLDATRYYDASVAMIAGADLPGVTFGALGNQDLKPERSSEVEAGIDAGLFAGRAGLEFTFYRKTTKDALIRRVVAPSMGASQNRWENIGSVLNRGIELTLNATPLDLEKARWDLTFTTSYNHNELLKLGEGVQPIISGKQRFVEGYPLGGYWDYEITYQDKNHDGMITPDEVSRADSATFQGNALPSTQLSLTSAVTVFKYVRVSGLLDYKGGYRNYNLTEEFRCRVLICEGLSDPNAPLWQQARGVQSITLGADRSAAPYIEDAHFLKLRELSVTFLLPDRWASRFGGRSLNLVLTGRNLGRWSDYTGLDPEINENGQSNFQQDEFLSQPPIRQWLARVNVSF